MAAPASDRFDRLPATRGAARAGAHRAPSTRRGWLRWLVATALSTAVLSGTGIGLLSWYSGSLNFTDLGNQISTEELPPYEIPVAEATEDPKVKITVLNATETTGLATTVGTRLRSAGWNIAVESTAARTDVAATTVYYNHLDYEGAARGVAESLGVTDVKLSTFYRGNRITVVLGADSAAA